MSKYNHSKSFFRKKYNDLKRYAQRNDIEFPYRSVREFESDWKALSVKEKANGEKKYNNIYGEMKYELQYTTGYNTALAEKQMLKELDTGSDIKLRDLKKMSTQDFAEIYKTEIMNAYNAFREEHPEMSTTDAKKFISINWFGSE